MGPDQVLDPVEVQLDAAVVEEDAERLPALEDVADGLAHLAGAGEALLLGAQPGAERIDQRLRPRPAGGSAVIRAAATDLGLDCVERGDAPERLFGHVRTGLRRGVDQLAPRGGPALREHERSAALAVVPGEALVAGVAVHLQNAVEASQRPFGVRTGPAWGVGEHDAGRVAAAPRAVVPRHRPEIARLGLAAAGIEHRDRGLVHVELAGLLQELGHPVDDRAQMPGRDAHPVGQRRAVHRHAVTGEQLALTIQGHVLGELGGHDVCDQRLRRQAALDQVRRRRRLDDARPTLRAGVARADGDQHAILRGHDVEPLGPILADPDHLPAAARAALVLRLDHPLDARQMGRQRAMGLRPFSRAYLRRLVGRGALLVSGLRLRDGGLDLLERQRELVGVELLRARAEPGAAHLAQERLQPRRISLLIGHLRLEVEARCALGGECYSLRLERCAQLRWQRGKIGHIGSGGHARRLPESGVRTTEKVKESDAWHYAAVSGARTRRGVIRRQSSPSNSASYCARDRRMTPSFTAGQANRPSSSRL